MVFNVNYKFMVLTAEFFVVKGVQNIIICHFKIEIVEFMLVKVIFVIVYPLVKAFMELNQLFF